MAVLDPPKGQFSVHHHQEIAFIGCCSRGFRRKLSLAESPIFMHIKQVNSVLNINRIMDYQFHCHAAGQALQLLLQLYS
jgi:hypothetical protein